MCVRWLFGAVLTPEWDRVDLYTCKLVKYGMHETLQHYFYNNLDFYHYILIYIPSEIGLLSFLIWNIIKKFHNTIIVTKCVFDKIIFCKVMTCKLSKFFSFKYIYIRFYSDFYMFIAYFHKKSTNSLVNVVYICINRAICLYTHLVDRILAVFRRLWCGGCCVCGVCVVGCLAWRPRKPLGDLLYTNVCWWWIWGG